MAAAEEGNQPIIELKQYVFLSPLDWYCILIEISQFETRIKQQNRELTALQGRHVEKQNEMETLGKDCQKIVCRISLFFERH